MGGVSDMPSGYLVSHPKLPSTYSVLLTSVEADVIRSECAEIGEGGKVERRSDLEIWTTFDELVDVMRNFY